MSEREYESGYIRRACEQLEAVRGKTLTLDQREKTAVELAGDMLREANRTITFSEKRVQAELARMMRDPKGKAFTMFMTDQCFRSHRSPRVANQMIYLLNQFGIPNYLDFMKR